MPSARSLCRILLIFSMALAVALIVGSLSANSVTFDETDMLGSVASGLHTGDYGLILYEPALTERLYSVPLRSLPLLYPQEPGSGARAEAMVGYQYGRSLLWGGGNDGHLIVRRARLAAPFCVLALALGVYVFTARAADEETALMAAGLTLFLPDVLGHGGLAYSDVPGAAGAFFALWATDAGLRRMGWQTGLVAGLAVGVALGTKISNADVVGLGLLLLWLQARVDTDPSSLWRRTAVFVGAAVVAAWAVLALAFADAALTVFRFDVALAVRHVQGGGTSFLCGRLSDQGFWYFYPLALLLKTPLALQLLMLVALAGGWSRWTWRRLALSPWRAPLVAVPVLMLAYMQSHLNIGFRHALPMMPWLCALAAAGCRALWQRRPSWRVVCGVLTVVSVVSSASWYPTFLPYVTDYVGRDQGWHCLADSSLDWGQGLPAVRDFEAEVQSPVYLGYFGTAVPDGYGIQYTSLPSFLRLDRRPAPTPRLPWLVVSASLVDDIGINVDWYSALRQAQPDRVLAHCMLAYRTDRPEVKALLDRLHL